MTVASWPGTPAIRQWVLFGAVTISLIVALAQMGFRYRSLVSRVERVRLKYVTIAGAGVFALLVVLINCLDGFSAGFGRLLGKHPLCPQISPGKTVEGALGGLFSCILVGYLASFLVPEWSPLEMAIASSLVAIFALLGDLVASSLKREAGIKDFSQALPGMGGILDRFDGLLFSAPVLYAYVRLTGAM